MFENEDEQMIIIYDDIYVADGIEILKKLCNSNNTKKIKVYVFSPNSYNYAADFEDFEEQIVLCALPEAIYRAYQNILPKHQKAEKIMESKAENTENTEINLFNQ